MDISRQPINEDLFDITLLKDIPIGFSRGNMVLPYRREAGVLKGIICGAQGRFALHEIAKNIGLVSEPIEIDKAELLDLINRIYGRTGSASEVMDDMPDNEFDSVATEFESPKDILELTEEAPIIRLLNALLRQAVKEQASDIHIEPYEKELQVRLRVDGMLRRILCPPKIIQDALVSRVKIMANLDIAEKRLPQDGRIRLLIGGQDIDIRVSVVPSVFGERVVLRLLDRKQGLIGLNALGLDERSREAFNSLLKNPHGIILVTGPTGSGKTTTLYAAINTIYSEQKNIMTIEDPVEYQHEGIGQLNVNTRIGLTFAAGLRSLLRHDPDVIMIGEIRDYDTAEIAIQASLTGHLVLSTLHTNDSASAVTRLIDMGIEPFLITSTLVGVLAQRLIRKICEYCKEGYSPVALEMEFFSNPPDVLYRGMGCPRCSHTGYAGRTGIFELLPVDGTIIPLIDRNTDAQKIKKFALDSGMKTLHFDGLKKAEAGVTTLQEVLRVTRAEHI
ncbi:type II secretion system ATPase GspE [Candidatus Magnetominusculus xianensis]|uniref:protein-secreting ATPase n=1 Tax=Candidatus Magnetominusculus xianensis TaxID=1748249 RepID=A0ABR5SAW6_9BACT|nr:type II secretion system ATPase GspE [Candidatus Magnetominusculus xianensis]KWT75009.1 type II secretion system protein GspE [Candidatus Magnetominusculus xianensis]